MIKKIITVCLLMVCNLAGKAESVDVDRATSIAKKFIMTERGLPQNGLVLNMKKNVRRVSPHGRTEEFPAYYVFTGSSGEGFIVVAGDDIAKPILAYSQVGSFEEYEQLPPNLQDWFNDMEEQILQARQQGIQQTTEIAEQWKAPNVGSSVIQLKTAKWNQTSPYNAQCPNIGGKSCVTGCVPTAYAILMKYYGYPLAGRGKTKEYVCKTSGIKVTARNLEHSYRWDQMPLEYESGNYSQTQANCVAQLMADIGAAIQVDYSKESTGGTIGEDALFVHFGYNPGNRKNRSDYSNNDWHSLLQSELKKSRPIIYRGTNPTSDSGHAFVIDGYTNHGYYSINWGWGKSHNGYFTLDALTPGTRNYTGNQKALFDFVPSTQLPCVAKVNNTVECPSFKTALALAPDDQQTLITLNADTKIGGEKVVEGKNITIDLNGHQAEIIGHCIYNYGHMSILDTQGGGKFEVKNFNTSIIQNYGSLVIKGGGFYNEVEKVDSNDYRRCLWTDERSSTHIINGKFSSRNQVICAKGGMTIDGGMFKAIDNSRVIFFACTTDTLKINGGEFKAIASNTNGCLWTASQSQTIITGGTFESYGKMITCNGTMTISDGSFTNMGNNSVINYYNTTGILKITGGIFTNTAPKPEGTDYRRCLWTDEGSSTHIMNGTFSSTNQVLCVKGGMTINGGSFNARDDGRVIYFACTNDILKINGGEFKATASNSNGCLWTATQSQALITGGTFESNGKMITCNGTMTINDGSFTNMGNNSIINYYNTTGILKITGGIFTNAAPKPDGTDYRRCLWTDANTTTDISGGTFKNEASTQTLCFRGNAIINGGSFENKGTGTGCLSSGSVTITDCMISADKVLNALSGASIICIGGIYSKKVESNYLKQGYFCSQNDDITTKAKYPFRVTLLSGIKGDVNNDGKVNILDAVLLIYYIYGDNPTIFNELAADVNKDKDINITDVVSLVNIILGKE